MNYIRKTAVILTAAAAMILGAGSALAADTRVEINELTGSISEKVAYTVDEAPVEIDNTLYVAARITAYAMGMTAEWDQKSTIATLHIDANQNSSMPIERFAYEMSSVVDNHAYSLQPDDISIDIRPGSQYALVKFNYIDNSGEAFTLGKTVQLDGIVRMVNANTLMFPLRSICECVGLDIGWVQENRTVSVSIPSVPKIVSGLGILSADTVLDEPEILAASAVTEMPAVTEAPAEEPVEKAVEESADKPNMVYLGTFKITHYAPGAESNGVWGNATAWAGNINPGVTIAVDKSVIAPLSWVYIDGYGYRRAEDCGGAIVGNTIDVAVATYAEAMRLGVVYKDVYLCVD